jgi:hypothetical protein
MATRRQRRQNEGLDGLEWFNTLLQARKKDVHFPSNRIVRAISQTAHNGAHKRCRKAPNGTSSISKSQP